MSPKKKETARKKSLDVAIVVAIIGGIVTIVAVFLTPIAPELAKRWFSTPIPSPSSTPISTETETPVIPVTETPSIVNSPEFFDNFNNDLSPQWENSQAWGGVNDMTTLKEGVTKGRMVVGDVAWKNYTVEVDVTSAGSDFASYLAGIAVHYQDEGNFVQFVINCDFPSGDTYWQYVRNGVQYDVSSTEKILLQCASFHVQIKVKDGEYTAYMNGELISSFNYDLFTSGKAGLLSAYNYGEFPAAFDNFSVSP